MNRRPSIVLSFLLLATACTSSPDLGQAALAALRSVPLDSLTFGACTTIELDPSVRVVRSFINLKPEASAAVTLSVAPESLETRLPLTLRPWNPNDPPSRAAQVIVGLLEQPRAPDTLSFVVVVTGCRLSGSVAHVVAWRIGSRYGARVRYIEEG